MKLKTILILSLIINIIFFSHIININANKLITNNNEYKILKTDRNYKIQIYYPITKYKTLNKAIKKEIKTYINEFKYNIKSSTIPINQYYHLIILYEKYEYQNYISYIFRIEDFTGGAHPNHRLYTIVYNKNENKIITIDDLIINNNELLNTLSNYTRDKLRRNKRITDISMLYEGTKPIKENFNNFIFSKNGLIIYFPQYQIAPYSQGEFNVIVPYNILFKNITF